MPETCTTDLENRLKELEDALSDVVYALNWVPNTRLFHPSFSNTYELVAYLHTVCFESYKSGA